MSAHETYIDVAAVRALATAHDRSAAVLGACARAVQHCTFGAEHGETPFREDVGAVGAGYETIGRALADWASSTAALAAGIARAVEHAENADAAAVDALRDVR